MKRLFVVSVEWRRTADRTGDFEVETFNVVATDADTAVEAAKKKSLGENDITVRLAKVLPGEMIDVIAR
jgi:hypothetical protein